VFIKPPTTNRGVEKKMPYPLAEELSERCHWIAFTVPFYKDVNWPDFIDQNWKEIRSIRNYNKARENTQGIKEFWHDTRPSQGKHIIVSGSTLDRMAENVISVLEWIALAEFHVSRIDLCVDATHTNLNPHNASYHLVKRQVKTHARAIPEWQDKWVGGFTQYIGKKTSETYVRIYDKASEMGVDFNWTRIEIVFQGDRGTPALKAYLQNKSVGALVKSFVDFPRWRKFQYVMGADKVHIFVPPKQTNTRIWLMESITLSIAKEMAMEDSHEFWLNFVQKIREEYLILTKEDIEVTF
jgi:hypothetical protein